MTYPEESQNMLLLFDNRTRQPLVGQKLKLASEIDLIAKIQGWEQLAVPPNHSLNRTHCGMRPKARHFILGL